MKKILSILLLGVIHSFAVYAQQVSASYQLAGNKIPYQIIYPEGYDSSKRYPLVIFLHGAGERGNDNQKQLTHGKQFLTDNFSAKYPAIVIAPQCPADDYWANVERNEIGGKSNFAFGITDEPTHAMATLMGLIEWWLASGFVDTGRVYAGGLSMGGMGTFELLWRMPNVFAAAFPICGGSSLDKMPLYARNTAVWVFHGSADNVVPVGFSRLAVERLEQLGGNVKYTEYEGVDHNSWDYAFGEEGLAPWLFSQRR